MAAWMSSGADSMRKASMAMSWVALPKATSSAKPATMARFWVGSRLASPTRPAAIIAWASSIQPRRWPKVRVSSGRARRSTTGAQKNLIE